MSVPCLWPRPHFIRPASTWAGSSPPSAGPALSRPAWGDAGAPWGRLRPSKRSCGSAYYQRGAGAPGQRRAVAIWRHHRCAAGAAAVGKGGGCCRPSCADRQHPACRGRGATCEPPVCVPSSAPMPSGSPSCPRSPARSAMRSTNTGAARQRSSPYSAGCGSASIICSAS